MSILALGVTIGALWYWQHIRSGEIHAVELSPEGHVLRCTWPLPVREIGRVERRDLRPWPELCARLSERRREYRTIGSLRIALAAERHGPGEGAGGERGDVRAWPIVARLGELPDGR